MKRFLSVVFLLLLLLGLISQCRSMKNKGQGIKGNVTWVEGNQMPTISEDIQSSPQKDDGTAVKRTILIYPLTPLADATMENSLFTSVRGKPIAQVESDEKGYFEIELAPGTYSLFTQEENGLFANTFDLNGNIQPISVERGVWTSTTISINYKAAY
ncbi:hypothetical protein SAMN04488104_101218 [Algoriphagus faecimaris]|uniref:Carboxypeptidase regulatory-like domain-containing protein n=2 Tax=Algoriphagus faecimaris TaxID=686796 RepID=A0A1G6RBN4_9BACT|nr:hypothetical protein SAMN04488104_101218 [Algoriphagus faecimaris]